MIEDNDLGATSNSSPKKSRSLFETFLGKKTAQPQKANKFLDKNENVNKDEEQDRNLLKIEKPQDGKPISQTSQQIRQQFQKQMSQMSISRKGIMKNPDKYTEEEVRQHQSFFQGMWQYRYSRYIDAAIRNGDWLKVYGLIGNFKEKCAELLKDIVREKIKVKEIDTLDFRYTMKRNSEMGIYLIDGIIIRIAKVVKEKEDKGVFSKKGVKNLHQEFLSYNIVNNLCISFAIQRPNFPRIRVPLTCLVKYEGYTALCQTDSPCEGLETLINGPTSQIYQSRPQAWGILGEIGKNLNLKPYKSKSNTGQTINIPFCITVQLHKITNVFKDETILDWIDPDSPLYPTNQKNNRLIEPEYYLLNFSKLWPLFIDSDITKSAGFLRPEVTLSWKHELSNSVFSKINAEKDEISELQLAEACKSVKDDNIKALVKFLDSASYFVVDSVSIEDIMHEHGINMRFLGYVASRFQLTCNQKIFEVEMIARVLKKIFFTNIEGFKQSVEQLYLDFLNFIFILSKDAAHFYLNVIYPQVQHYYEYTMKEYPPSFQGGGLLHAICYHFGIKMSVIDYPFYKDMDIIFNHSHLIDSVCTVRSYDLDVCPLKKVCENYKTKKAIIFGDEEVLMHKEGSQLQKLTAKPRKVIIDECLKELHLLVAMNNLSHSEATIGVTSHPAAFYLAELAEICLFIGDDETSLRYAEMSIKLMTEKHVDLVKPFCVLVKYYSKNKKKENSNRSIEFYQKSQNIVNYHLSHNHPLHITVFNTLGYEFVKSDPGKCEKLFQRSFQICEQALGYMHATSGKILLQLSNLPVSTDKKIHFLLQALTILENIDSENKDKVILVCRKICELYEELGNLNKMIYYARKSKYWKKEVQALQDLNEHKQVLQLCYKKPDNIDDMKYLIEKSFTSIIKLLDRAPISNLYKLFVSLSDGLPDSESASNDMMNYFNPTSASSTTVAEFIKSNINSLIGEIPDLFSTQNFFFGDITLHNCKQPRINTLIKNYMDILAIVGKVKAEAIFTSDRRQY